MLSSCGRTEVFEDVLDFSGDIVEEQNEFNVSSTEITNESLLPAYGGNTYVIWNDNIPTFDGIELPSDVETVLSSLDELGRTQQAYALLSEDHLYGERQDIMGIKPSGWHTIRYDDLIEDKYLYNRCHLIANMFDDSNNVIENLITGTRYLNTEGMLPFEIQIADYMLETHNHVVYCVTPIYDGNELVARGVQIEALSFEDDGASLSFNVFCYNVQPGIEIDYATGMSWIKFNL